jgi:mRNA interferase RelE/StbE
MTALYSVEFTSEAKKQIKKLDHYEAILISPWIHKNIEGCMDLRAHGKALTAQFKEYWRYRVSNYRLMPKLRTSVF